jgi:hypothetical protein
MSIDNELKKFETEFYKITCQILFNTNAAKWMGKVRILRKDTNEIVNGGFRVFDNEEIQLEQKIVEKLNQSIKSDLAKLGVPYEWNSKGRKVLVRYLELRSEITEYGLLCDQIIAGKEDKSLLSDKYERFWYEIIEEALNITRDIEKLTEQERLDMLTLPESVFIDPADPWNLDEMDSRGGIINLFLNPSEQEKNITKFQTNKIIELYHQLGWDNDSENLPS